MHRCSPTTLRPLSALDDRHTDRFAGRWERDRFQEERVAAMVMDACHLLAQRVMTQHGRAAGGRTTRARRGYSHGCTWARAACGLCSATSAPSRRGGGAQWPVLCDGMLLHVVQALQSICRCRRLLKICKTMHLIKSHTLATTACGVCIVHVQVHVLYGGKFSRIYLGLKILLHENSTALVR